MTFEQLGLSAELLRAVANEGYTTPTPVQEKSIPVVLQGHDILAGAQTGTGKTAGFTLPMLQLMQKVHPERHKRHVIRALVLTPTRELAAQVGESIATYGRHLPLKSTVVFGGVGVNPQIEKLKRGVDILVATPGRLLDLVGQGKADLGHVEFFVLDEADRMLDMGFIHDIRKVLKLLPKQRQNLLFSATFSDEIKQLANGFLRSPVYVEVARNETAHQVTQVVHPVSKSKKRALLSHLIKEGDWKQVLVFTKTKHGANRLTTQLESDGIQAAAIHGNKSQTARTKALAAFKDGNIRVLVATDIAARGLDIDQLPHVVNYELPNVAEDYVHRIGRTGRAGCSGESLSLVSGDENKLLAGIERLIKKSITKVVVPGFEPGNEEETATPAPQRRRPDHRRHDPSSPRKPHSTRGRRPGRRERAAKKAT
ncbi:ATP-dependent RNA helicase RhlE [Mariprofundus ferrinatatus]|uniref:DEAD-box ATP-dependent RNA helicase RhpA n=1 Tax=Mariprofundus ferrinatatus TaxID=1921087 RepID=A0A2K8L1T8_9PROT|nr:DEAD/DEAH box helicase [Mariprofundus ferrinatatus]ATX81290.1 ATP-dependent RNA helicase RhlE [Mariprofundus ferrinatatus]